MNTKQTVERYFDLLARKNGWQDMLADDIAFTSHTSPNKSVTGKQAYLEATKRFYSTIARFDVKDVITDGDTVCAFTRYEIQPPNGGSTFESDVAEVFTVRNDKIGSLGIYFDSAPFPK